MGVLLKWPHQFGQGYSRVFLLGFPAFGQPRELASRASKYRGLYFGFVLSLAEGQANPKVQARRAGLLGRAVLRTAILSWPSASCSRMMTLTGLRPVKVIMLLPARSR